MGCIISSLVQCCICSTAQCLCGACSSCCGGSGSQKHVSIWTRIIYVAQLIVLSAVAWILSNIPTWTSNVESPWWWALIPSNVINCPNTDDGDCKKLLFGPMNVYRITCALAIFHLLMAVLMIGVRTTGSWRTSLQNGFWIFKFFALVGIIVVSAFIPNFVFTPYGWAALIGAGLFILVQLILLVDFAHTWSETWVGYYEETQARGWAALLLGSTVFMYIAALVGTILLYYFFSSGCAMNTAFITVNLVLCFLLSACSIHSRVQESNRRVGLLQSAVVTVYATYLIWSAIMSQPEPQCRNNMDSRGDAPTAIIGVVVTFLAVTYSAFTASNSSKEIMGDEEQGTEVPDTPPAEEEKKEESSTDGAKAEAKTADAKAEAAPLINSKKAKKTRRHKDDDDDSAEEDVPVPYNYSYFHVMFALAAMYLCMLLTNWRQPELKPDTNLTPTTSAGALVDFGAGAVWVKAASSWAVCLLYGWTLLAPLILPDRFEHLMG